MGNMPFVASAVNGFRNRHKKVQALAMCKSIFEQSRSPQFYREWNVPDTLEGRFDCAALHLALVLRHCKGPLAQALFDSFFSYLDLTLREVGVSDLKVGRQVKKCAESFYGALKAYDTALTKEEGLEEALQRNLYGGHFPLIFEPISTYIKKCDRLLQNVDFEKTTDFPWPPFDECNEDL